MTTHTCEHSGITFPVKDAWISVRDKMPEHDQFVLASNKNGIMAVLRCDLHRNGYEIIDYVFMNLSLTRQITGITHWQPLPEPPKE